MLDAGPSARERLVPACAPWRAHDLLAHLVSMPAAILSGARPNGDVNEWLGELIRERANDSAEQLVTEWVSLDDALPSLLTGPSELLFGDLAIHEHDLRAALGKPDHNALEVDVLMPRTLAAFARPLREAGLGAIAIETRSGAWKSHDAAAGWTLLTDAWTAVRAVNSRRT